MSMSLGFRFVFRCGVCGQAHDEQVAADNRVSLALWGCGPGFPYCPCCMNDAQHLMGREGYQKRARRWLGIKLAPLPLLTPEPPDPMLAPIPWTDAVLGVMVRRPPTAAEWEPS